jgi:hypothetical protein
MTYCKQTNSPAPVNPSRGKLVQFYELSVSHLERPPSKRRYSDPEVVMMQAKPIDVQLPICCGCGVLSLMSIGHDFAKYAESCVAGVPSIDDAPYLVGEHAKLMGEKLTPQNKNKKRKHTTPRIRRWSPTRLLVRRLAAYLWESRRDPEFSTTCGRM